jgi:hypothetical protein
MSVARVMSLGVAGLALRRSDVWPVEDITPWPWYGIKRGKMRTFDVNVNAIGFFIVSPSLRTTACPRVSRGSVKNPPKNGGCVDSLRIVKVAMPVPISLQMHWWLHICKIRYWQSKTPE